MRLNTDNTLVPTIRFHGAILKLDSLRPDYKCWSWLNDSVVVVKDDYTLPETAPHLVGPTTIISIRHRQTHLFKGLLELQEVWPLLMNMCFEEGILCESLDDLNRQTLELPELLNASIWPASKKRASSLKEAP